MSIEQLAARLDKLNDEQRCAVDQIYGQVIVVAGPGTGKTELLTTRAANILAQTDASPSNILCLTFTEAAAANMTKRLAGIIGADAYKVEINTFHGFGSSIIGRYGDYFFNGASRQPADDLKRARIMSDILSQLEPHHPFASRNDGKFVYTSTLLKVISDFKNAALTPDEVRQLATAAQDFCRQIASDIADATSERISLKQLGDYADLAQTAKRFAESQPTFAFSAEPKLGQVLADSLTSAIEDATALNKTTPITEWKKAWLTKDPANTKRNILKDAKRSTNLLLAADIYERYNAALLQQGLYDFDDMILQAIHALQDNPDLKADLQEQYQFIMVDEFQDTNDSQLRLLFELTSYDDPNILIVGDDDQAIYRFQGADISNISHFKQRFPRFTQVDLTKNYRSGHQIIESSQVVAQGIADRLRNMNGNIKTVTPEVTTEATVSAVSLASPEAEYDYLATQIDQRLKAGEDPAEIAVISRTHKTLEPLLPYLSQHHIGVNYEHSGNVFNSEPIQLLLTLARTVQALSEDNLSDLSTNLPQLLAAKAFGLSPELYYTLGVNARLSHDRPVLAWLEQLAGDDRTKPLVDWLKTLAVAAVTTPLNTLLLQLVGITPTEVNGTTFVSPIYRYYFSPDNLPAAALNYLRHLNDLRALLDRLSNYQPDQPLKLRDLITFVNQCNQFGVTIQSHSQIGDNQSINLMTAHKSKGLEFKTVFVINATSEAWGSKSKRGGGQNKFSYPSNLNIGNVDGSDDDERRRLLYVAMTRAKQELIITRHTSQDNKELNQLEYLLHVPSTEVATTSIAAATRALELSFMQDIITPVGNWRQLLRRSTDNFALSATALNDFIDLKYSGPQRFMQRYILGIPEADSISSAFGSAIHAALHLAHNQLNTTGQIDLDAVLNNFQQDMRYRGRDFPAATVEGQLNYGRNVLEQFITQRSDLLQPGQASEVNFNATLDGGVRLKGKLDLLEVNPQLHAVTIIDYKTGDGFSEFTTSGIYKDKCHRYANQLMFYRLLLRHSSQYAAFSISRGALQFVEPNKFTGEIYTPSFSYDDNEQLERFEQLVRAVWQHVMALDFPDISAYQGDTAQFEADLIAGAI